MDESSFFEYPLNKNSYEPKNFVKQAKQPLRILVTEAGCKIAHNLIYKICDGSVFGQDQEIILHLINARGVLHHKTIVLELEECGFPCLKDYVMSSNPAVAFKNVEIVIAITKFQEISGFIIPGAIVYQTNKAFQLVKNVQNFATKNCKIIFTGPATKALTVMLSALNKVFPDLNAANISCVTHLDTIIAKSVLAAKLKTSTDQIKNVIIWSATYPDVRNATITMYPPDDTNPIEKKEIPISDILQDEEWLYTSFGLAIYRRIMNVDLLKYGKAIAMSTTHHLKVLFGGSDKFEEIPSMAVITPSTSPYGLPEGNGLSFPVKTENGTWTILENVPVNVATQLNMMRTLLKSDEEKVKNALIKVLSRLNTGDITELQMTHNFPHDLYKDLMEIKKWTAKYYVVPNLAETGPKFHRTKNFSRKSIAWSEAVSLVKTDSAARSALFFDVKQRRDSRANSIVNSTDFSLEIEHSWSGSRKSHQFDIKNKEKFLKSHLPNGRQRFLE